MVSAARFLIEALKKAASAFIHSFAQKSYRLGLWHIRTFCDVCDVSNFGPQAFIGGSKSMFQKPQVFANQRLINTPDRTRTCNLRIRSQRQKHVVFDVDGFRNLLQLFTLYQTSSSKTADFPVGKMRHSDTFCGVLNVSKTGTIGFQPMVRSVGETNLSRYLSYSRQCLIYPSCMEVLDFL